MASLLIDEGISHALVDMLNGQGFTVIHWLDIGRKGAHDALVFLTAQQRRLVVFTWNRDDFIFAAICWQAWGLGDHQGLIVPRPRKYHAQLPPEQLYPIMARFCADTSTFVNRIEVF